MPKKIGDIKLYSLKELSKILGVSELTLRTYCRTGRLKGRKLGTRWYVTEASLREYFENPGENNQDKEPQVRGA